MFNYIEKIASAEFHLTKPQASPLCAEVPCNYIHGRLAAALQSIFVSCNSARAIFLIYSYIIDFHNYLYSRVARDGGVWYN